MVAQLVVRTDSASMDASSNPYVQWDHNHDTPDVCVNHHNYIVWPVWFSDQSVYTYIITGVP